MRFRLLAAAALFLFAVPLFSQQNSSPQLPQPPEFTPPAPHVPLRDPQALAILQASVKAMGGAPPSDSTAIGTAEITEGSLHDTGTVRIQTRSSDQYSSTLELSSGLRTIVYSKLRAVERPNWNPHKSSVEWDLSSQAPDFPLVLLAEAVGNADFSASYVGSESLNGHAVLHLRTWDSFYSANPRLAGAAQFSAKDVWVNLASGLVDKISYLRQGARGRSTPSFRVEIVFSDYRDISGRMYPFSITKSYNGTPWQVLTIQTVSFNTGLTDGSFPLN